MTLCCFYLLLYLFIGSIVVVQTNFLDLKKYLYKKFYSFQALEVHLSVPHQVLPILCVYKLPIMVVPISDMSSVNITEKPLANLQFHFTFTTKRPLWQDRMYFIATIKIAAKSISTSNLYHTQHKSAWNKRRLFFLR